MRVLTRLSLWTLLVTLLVCVKFALALRPINFSTDANINWHDSQLTYNIAINGAPSAVSYHGCLYVIYRSVPHNFFTLQMCMNSCYNTTDNASQLDPSTACTTLGNELRFDFFSDRNPNAIVYADSLVVFYADPVTHVPAYFTAIGDFGPDTITTLPPIQSIPAPFIDTLCIFSAACNSLVIGYTYLNPDTKLNTLHWATLNVNNSDFTEVGCIGSVSGGCFTSITAPAFAIYDGIYFISHPALTPSLCEDGDEQYKQYWALYQDQLHFNQDTPLTCGESSEPYQFGLQNYASATAFQQSNIYGSNVVSTFMDDGELGLATYAIYGEWTQSKPRWTQSYYLSYAGSKYGVIINDAPGVISHNGSLHLFLNVDLNQYPNGQLYWFYQGN